MTPAQLRILAAAGASRKPIDVWGRQMAAVDNLKKAGLITVEWKIEHGGQQDRWHGYAAITPLGRAKLKEVSKRRKGQTK